MARLFIDLNSVETLAGLRISEWGTIGCNKWAIAAECTLLAPTTGCIMATIINF